VIAQDPTTCSFDPMPSNAIATGLVDYLAKPHDMPGLIVRHVKQQETLRNTFHRGSSVSNISPNSPMDSEDPRISTPPGRRL
jgi:two-component system CheB/CheR fusion protein